MLLLARTVWQLACSVASLELHAHHPILCTLLIVQTVLACARDLQHDHVAVNTLDAMSTSSQAIVVEKLGEDKLAKLGAIQSGAKVRSLATTDF